MVKNGLDPHMITEFEHGLKLCYMVMLAIFLWRILSFMLKVGWYIFMT
jgi:hypothetical protein